jgi:hypothetical protein
MGHRSSVLALALGLGLLFAVVAGAAAKAGIMARLDAPLPTDAHSGQELTIGWTLTVPGSSGLIGTAVVLRVFPVDGGTPSDWPAREDRANHWVASGTVPPGGLATIGIGIPGTGCIGTVCAPAIDFFTVTDPSGAPIPSPGAVPPPATSTSPATPRTHVDASVALLIAILLGSVSLAGAAWRLRRA